MLEHHPRRAASRFGMGFAHQDLQAAGNDPVGWLRAQLQSAEPGPPAPASRTTLADAARALRALRRRRQGTPESSSATNGADTDGLPDRRRRERRAAVMAQSLERFRHAVLTRAPYRERLVHFWSNHFTVSMRGRPQIAATCLAYENEAIRASLDGHFSAMLRTVVAHPVMLIYLDNAQSVGAESPAGRRRGRGANENLAREILELHTLGVDGGYGQADVQALAGMLTGWTVGSERFRGLGAEPGAFAFVPAMHQPGSFRLLGRRYPEDGVDQARAALTDLARHPATARHLATRLVRHFVADDPPADAVETLARVFRETDGHLPSVHAALLDLPQAWDPHRRKLKTPFELLVSAHRALDAPMGPERTVLGPLQLMNHVPFSAPSPAGWPDRAAHWGAPTALKQRVAWGLAMGHRLAGDVAVSRATKRLLPEDDVALAGSVAAAASPGEALGLLLAAPAFQWR